MGQTADRHAGCSGTGIDRSMLSDLLVPGILVQQEENGMEEKENQCEDEEGKETGVT